MIILKEVIHYKDTNSVEATWVDENDIQVKCHSYADVQMDMLRADLGDDIAAYEELITLVEANITPYIPPLPPTPEELAMRPVIITQGQLDELLSRLNTLEAAVFQ
jgi:hypothetical protein